jgi:WD40 repeat protein
MGGLTLRAWRVQPGRFEVPANAGAGVDGEAEGLHAKGQRFFKGHDQAVSALALCEGEQPREAWWKGRLAASGQRMVALGPGARAAALSEGNTGETRDDGAQAAGLGPEALREAVPQRRGRAYVCVWDTRELRELARIGYYREGFGGSVVSLDFSPGGERLACLTNDRRHSLSVWDWRQESPLIEVATQQGRVDFAAFNPFARVCSCGRRSPACAQDGGCGEVGAEILITCGKRHLKLWTLQGIGAPIPPKYPHGEPTPNPHARPEVVPTAAQLPCGRLHCRRGGGACPCAVGDVE